MDFEKLNWQEFFVTDLFPSIQRGKRLTKANQKDGNIPYISSTALNNGVDNFISSSSKMRIFENCLSVANSGSVGSSFYEPYKFVASDHITHLKNIEYNEFIYLFISVMTNRWSAKYNFNREISDKRISREKILLPVNSNGLPDFQIMEQIIRESKGHKYSLYIEYANSKLNILTYKSVEPLNMQKWKPFEIGSLFPIIEPGKGKGLNHLNITDDFSGINYIGATNRNNGVLCQVEINPKSKKLIQKGNCIGFIRNGNGSVGYAIYKSEDFISTSDVSFAYNDFLNKYNGLFIVASSDLIRGKYNHNYKRTPERLKKDCIMLPATDSGEPDYLYMEQYVKNMMIAKYQSYLDYVNR